jgi:hypothetical protein
MDWWNDGMVGWKRRQGGMVDYWIAGMVGKETG